MSRCSSSHDGQDNTCRRVPNFREQDRDHIALAQHLVGQSGNQPVRRKHETWTTDGATRVVTVLHNDIDTAGIPFNIHYPR